MVNLYLRKHDAERGTLVGTIDPLGDEPQRMRDTLERLGVGGQVTSIWYQFINDERGAGLEFAYEHGTEPDD